MSLSIGAIVSIPVSSGLTSNNVLCAANCRFEIVGETEKAWKVESLNDTGKTFTAYLPKKALSVINEGQPIFNQPYFFCRIAKWFRPEGWTAKFLTLATNASTLAA